MKTINSILNLITPSCFMTELDVKDAYCLIPILTENQNYFKFVYNRRRYQFSCLPDGLCSVPQKFTNLFKPPLVSLRKLRVTVAAYIDDLIVVAKMFY